jgi:hypothetical protein
MKPHRVEASVHVAAPASRVYGILADYRDGHQRILPPRYFQGLRVESGGVGAGTTIHVDMRVLGRARSFRATVTEPEPGRVLAETDVDTGTVTTFTVDPGADGASAVVTIATELGTRGGLAGAVERTLTTAFLRRVYIEELGLLKGYAERQRAAGAGTTQSAPRE